MSTIARTIAAFAEGHRIPLSEEAPERLADYVALLLKANDAMNLIGPMTAERVATELVGDSLMVLGVLQGTPARLTGPLADVGSGAGLPGIPLAIARPELEIHLIEPRDRRYRFLGMAIRRLGLENVHRHRARIEELELPPMSAAISRAFAPVPRWLDVSHELIQRDGLVVVCAAATDVEGVEDPRFDKVAEHAYELEGTVERSVLILQKKS